MKRKLPYQEGTLFAVPLRNGGYGLGLVARLSGDGLVFGYFFGPLRTSIPVMGDVGELSAEDSILRLRFGDLGLLNGEWPIVGQFSGFTRSNWPLPPFVRVDSMAKKAWKTLYTETLEFISETPCDLELAKENPEDCLAGYGSVEKKLTRLLAD